MQQEGSPKTTFEGKSQPFEGNKAAKFKQQMQDKFLEGGPETNLNDSKNGWKEISTQN